MRAFIDTSVLVAAMVESHPHHDRSVEWLEKTQAGKVELIVASHSIAELFAVLTTLPLKPRISPSVAWRLIHDNIEGSADIVALAANEQVSVVKRLAEAGVSGGAVYDGLLAAAAEKAGATRLVTLNGSDFRRVWPSIAGIVVSP